MDKCEKSSAISHSRKGSDAPSIGEVKGSAPLASADSEGLSDGLSEIESSCETDHEQELESTQSAIPIQIQSKERHDTLVQDEGDDVTLYGNDQNCDNEATPLNSPFKSALKSSLFGILVLNDYHGRRWPIAFFIA